MNITKLRKTKMPILILGETGTGKTRLAKDISEGSSRFLHLNVSSLSSGLFESELFGHVKGAFTGCVQTRNGFCEEVSDGVLFLDEIGELNMELQAKLLTLIDERLFYPVGSSRPKTFKGRLIVATNKNLLHMVKEGVFREDLYYRLRMIEIKKQPLREKTDKNKIIIEEINQFKLSKGKNLIFEKEVLNLMFNYSWPGNYRELKNTIEYIFDLSENKVTIKDLPSWILESKKFKKDAFDDFEYQSALAIFEESFFTKLLEHNQGRVNKSAQLAGISKVTLISKLKKYGINRHEYHPIASVVVG